MSKIDSTYTTLAATFIIKQALNPDHGVYCQYTKNGSDPYKLTFFDSKGMKLRECYDIDGGTVLIDYDYDSLGRLISESRPYYMGTEEKKLTQYSYDDFGNVVSTTHPNGYIRNMEYDYSIDGVAVTTTTDRGRTVSMTDHFNRLLWSENEVGQRVSYTYDISGRCISADANGLVTNFDHSVSAGTKSTIIENDDFGRVINKYDENDQRTLKNGQSYVYDLLGNYKTRYMTMLSGDVYVTDVHNYKYIANKPFLLESIEDSRHSFKKEYTYDNYNRISSEKETIDNKNFTSSMSYDENNRVKTFTYPNGFTISYEYSGDIVTCIRNATDGSIIWKANAIYPSGKPMLCQYGDSIFVTYTYDPATDRMLSADYGKSLKLIYTLNNRGLVASRHEDFKLYDYGYDRLNRLSSVSFSYNRMADTIFPIDPPIIGPFIPRDSLGIMTQSLPGINDSIIYLNMEFQA